MAALNRLNIVLAADASELSAILAGVNAQLARTGAVATEVNQRIAGAAGTAAGAGPVFGRSFGAAGAAATGAAGGVEALAAATTQAGTAAAGAAGGFAALKAGVNVGPQAALSWATLTTAINATDTATKKALLTTESFKKVAGGMRQLGMMMTLGVTLPAVLLGASFVKAAADMDSLKRGLTAVAGSSKEAEAQMKRLEEVARLPGLGFREAIQGSINLQAAGFSARMAERSLMAVGNALATVGKGKVELERVNYQLTQMANKAGGYGQDIRVLSESLPQIRQTLIKAFGTADTEIISKSGKTGKQVVEAIVTELEKLPKMTGGVQNAFENLSDAWYRAKVALGNQLIPAILPLVEGLSKLLETTRELDGATLRNRLAWLATAAVMGPLIGTIGAVTQAIIALMAAGASLAAVTGIGAILVVGLGLLSKWFIQNKLDALAAAAAAEQYKASLVGLAREQLDNSLASTFSDTNRLQERRQELVDSGKAYQLVPQRRGMDANLGVGEVISVATPEVAALDAQIKELNQRASALTAEIGRQDALNAQVSTPTTPISTGGAGKNPLDALKKNASELVSVLEDMTARGEDASGVVARLRGMLANVGAQIVRNPLSGPLRDLRKQLEDALAKPLEVRFAAADGATKRLFGQLEAAAEVKPLRMRTVAMSASAAPDPARSNVVRLNSMGWIDRLREVGQTFLATARNTGAPAGSGVSRGSRAFIAAEGGAVKLGQALRGMPNMLMGAFGPMAMISTVLGGAMEGLAPLMGALKEPLRIVGKILGSALAPILKALFPIFKGIAIAATWVGQIFFQVSGWITKAVGQLVRGLGRLINKLPGSPGDPLIRAGQALIDLGAGMQESADALKQGREELKNLTWGDALAAQANKAAEALSNVPEGFRVFNAQGARFNATAAPGGGGIAPPDRPTYTGATSGASAVSSSTVTLNVAEGAIRISDSRNPRETAREVVRALKSALSVQPDPLGLGAALPELR